MLKYGRLDFLTDVNAANGANAVTGAGNGNGSVNENENEKALAS
jgi:hypothetical protein